MTDDIAENIVALLAVRARGLPIEVSPMFPFRSLNEKEPGTIHGCIFGTGKDQRAWVSKELFDALAKHTEKKP